jgi:hypothetical protein
MAIHPPRAMPYSLMAMAAYSEHVGWKRHAPVTPDTAWRKGESVYL